MFPPWLQALVLGIVQGLTEFIPVSSSGHLVLTPYLLGFEDRSLAFDVMLHVGTLGAVLLYFRGEIWAITQGLVRLDRSPQGEIYRRVGLFIVPASIPIAVVGLLAAEQVEQIFESPLAAALFLLATAALLIGMERHRGTRVARATGGATGAQTASSRAPAEDAPTWAGDWRAGEGPAATATSAPARRTGAGASLPLGVDPSDPLGDPLGRLTLRQAMIVGVFQCLAVLPGISRSGATISAGVFGGLTREAATRFSFLLAIPALLGATVVSLPDLAAPGAESAQELAVGMVAAFASGYAAVRYLVALVSRERLTGFAYYCIAASLVGIVGYLMIGPPGTV